MSKKGEYLAMVSCSWIIGINAYTRLTNPDMSETRLFLTFWHWYLMAFAAMVITYIGLALYFEGGEK